MKKNSYIQDSQNPEITHLYVRKKNGDVILYLVDTKFLDRIQSFTWHSTASKGYLRTSIKRQQYGFGDIMFGKRRHNHVYDHKNRDVFDNRASNLRHLSWRANTNHKARKCTGKTGIYGIFYAKETDGYRVRGTTGALRHTKSLAKATLIFIQRWIDLGMTVSEAFEQMRILSNPEAMKKIEQVLHENRSVLEEQ